MEAVIKITIWMYLTVSVQRISDFGGFIAGVCFAFFFILSVPRWMRWAKSGTSVVLSWFSFSIRTELGCWTYCRICSWSNSYPGGETHGPKNCLGLQFLVNIHASIVCWLFGFACWVSLSRSHLVCIGTDWSWNLSKSACSYLKCCGWCFMYVIVGAYRILQLSCCPAQNYSIWWWIGSLKKAVLATVDKNNWYYQRMSLDQLDWHLTIGTFLEPSSDVFNKSFKCGRTLPGWDWKNVCGQFTMMDRFTPLSLICLVRSETAFWLFNIASVVAFWSMMTFFGVNIFLSEAHVLWTIKHETMSENVV